MKAEIKIDWDKKIIRCGNLFTLYHYERDLDWRKVVLKLGLEVGRGSSGYPESNKKASQLLGTTPTKYAYMLKGCQYKLWIKGKEDLIYRFCIRNGHYSSQQIELLNRNYDIVQQYIKDGLDNLLPLALKFGKTTAEFKKLLGKAAWKRVCKNSTWRNKLLCQRTKLIDHIDGNNKLPSTVLQFYSVQGDITIPIRPSLATFWAVDVIKNQRQLSYGKAYYTRLVNLYTDTKRMSKSIGRPFSHKWSEDKMGAKHDEYTELLHYQKYSIEPIDRLKTIPVKTYEDETYKAKLLDTPYKIYQQGKTEHHCVGSYIPDVQEGRYLVYDILNKDTGYTESTLGVRRTIKSISNGNIIKKEKFHFSQHYKAYNRCVKDDLNRFGECVINQLNERSKQ